MNGSDTDYLPAPVPTIRDLPTAVDKLKKLYKSAHNTKGFEIIPFDPQSVEQGKTEPLPQRNSQWWRAAAD